MSDEVKQVTGELVDSMPAADDTPLPLSLRRTKAYAKKLLKDISPKELVELVTQQAQLVILALGEYSLKVIEDLNTEEDVLKRALLQDQLERTLARSGDMAQKKSALLAAFGYDATAITQDEDGRPIAAVTKTSITKDQFESMFASLNPFASVQDAEFVDAKKVVEAVLSPDEKADLDRTIKDAAGKAVDRIRKRFDDPSKLD